jgi:hypothetical protein
MERSDMTLAGSGILVETELNSRVRAPLYRAALFEQDLVAATGTGKLGPVPVAGVIRIAIGALDQQMFMKPLFRKNPSPRIKPLFLDGGQLSFTFVGYL